MTELADYQKHIVGETTGVALCGAKDAFGFTLLGLDHAVNCIFAGDRLLPCPDCWAAVLTIAESDPNHFVSAVRAIDAVELLKYRAEHSSDEHTHSVLAEAAKLMELDR